MDNLEEKSVYQYFSDLFYSKQMGREDESMQDFLVKFAKQNGLNFFLDQASNIVIKDGGQDEKTTLLVCLDFCTKKPIKKWFDFSFLGGKLTHSGDYVLSSRVPLCAESLGGVAIALHTLKTQKNIQAIFVFDKKSINKIFDAKDFNSSKVIQLVADNQEGLSLFSPFACQYVAKCSNEKYFLTNSFELKTFKLSIFENEKQDKNLALKLLVELLGQIKDAKVNKLHSGFVSGNEYKNEVYFTTFMPLLEIKNLIKSFYEQKRELYPTFALRCTRQINQTLVLSNNQILDFISDFKENSTPLDDEQTCNAELLDVNSNSGFVNFELSSRDLKCLKQQFEIIKDNAKLKNIDCVCFDEMSSFSPKKSILLEDIAKVNSSFNRAIFSYNKPSILGEIVSKNKKLDALILSFQVENLTLPDEKLIFSSLVNTSLYLENYLNSLSNKS